MTQPKRILLSCLLLGLWTAAQEAAGQLVPQTNLFTRIFFKDYQVDEALVVVMFQLETDGSVSNVQTARVQCKRCSAKFKRQLRAEAERKLRAMPTFPPPSKATRYNLPLRFQFRED